MPGRGPQTFKKRQREQARKERQQEKMAARLQRKEKKESGEIEPEPELEVLTEGHVNGIIDPDNFPTSRDS